MRRVIGLVLAVAVADCTAGGDALAQASVQFRDQAVDVLLTLHCSSPSVGVRGIAMPGMTRQYTGLPFGW